MPDFSDLEMRFLEAFAIIALACFFVPFAKWLKLGTIIGYLLAGVAAGAFLSFSFSDHPEELLHFAEFGIVLFLFVIGLEFRPARLWEMRGDIFGRGLIQVLLCGGLLAVPPLLFGLSWQASLIIGLGLSLSSTALVMQTLDETGERGSAHGRTAISILLFEDLAIVPLLLLVQLLAPTSGEPATLMGGLQSGALGLAAIGFLIFAGRYLLDPMFRILAGTRVPEIMTASALGIVIFSALLMDAVGMSYAMGSFIAGVMLAGSLYRHEVEADIEPFRGLFLGLFFVAVGLTLDLGIVADNWLLILCAVPLLMILKAIAIYAVARIFRSAHMPSLRTALALSQHGEFGYVLFAAAASAALFSAETASILVSIVTLSMALSSLSDKLAERLSPTQKATEMEEDYSDAQGRVLLIGFGRFGQLAAQPLLRQGVDLAILDNDTKRVEEAAAFGRRIHFGDGARRDILRAAGAEDAQYAIVAVDSSETANAIVALLHRDFPHLKIFARAYDRIHAIQLTRLGATHVVRETAESALSSGGLVLSQMGLPDTDIADVLDQVRSDDIRRLKEQTTLFTASEDRAEIVEKIKPTPLSQSQRGPS